MCDGRFFISIHLELRESLRIPELFPSRFVPVPNPIPHFPRVAASLRRQHFPWASQLFEQPKMDREYFMHLADRFRSPHLWKWEDNMWKLRHTPYEGDSEVLWGDPKGTHHEI